MRLQIEEVNAKEVRIGRTRMIDNHLFQERLTQAIKMRWKSLLILFPLIHDFYFEQLNEDPKVEMLKICHNWSEK